MLKRFLLLRGIEVIALAAARHDPADGEQHLRPGVCSRSWPSTGSCLIGLDVTVGYLGQVNLAQAAFLGLGAYAAGLTVTLFGFGMVTALAMSMLIGLVFGGLLAFPALRLEGPQFASGDAQLLRAHHHGA